MHIWGDEWFEKNGDDLYKAQNYIVDFTYRWSRCRLVSKEKYGTIRYEALFPPYCGYFIRDNWIDKFLRLFGDETVSYSVEGKTRSFTRRRFYWHETTLSKLWAKFGKLILGIAVKRACNKYPNVSNEILDDLDEF